MPGAAVELVREIYGHNWASLRSRREGLSLGLEIFADEFEYQLDPTAFGDRTLTGEQDIETFLQGFEEDFRELRQRPDRILEAGATETGERVVVLGEIVGRGRLSGLPFRSPFGHVWTIRDGKAVRLEGYLDHDVALAAAGLAAG
jgi:ketosteroid isomerase-like protein